MRPSGQAERYAAGMVGFDNPTEFERLRLRERLIDVDTRSVLEEIGLGVGWRCLELGAGTGSIAGWLARRCPDGSVIATDIDTRYLDRLTGQGLANLEIRRHDVVREGFPPGWFQLIHARSLLANLPERNEVIPRLVSWLAPGGWLVLEDPAIFPIDSALYPPYQRLMRAFEDSGALSHGADLRWARRLPAMFAPAGLTEVGMRVFPQYVGDGGAGEAIWRVALTQARPFILSAGLLTSEQFAEGMALFDDPSFLDLSIAMVSVWGRLAENARM